VLKPVICPGEVAHAGLDSILPGQWLMVDVVMPYVMAAAVRYRLAAERPNRPAGEALDLIIMQALDPEAAAGEGSSTGQQQQQGSRGLLDNLTATVASMQRFMRSLSN
jgi:hypothetical protein